MNTIVEKKVEELIEREGGYVDHPNDRGGPTKYGITLETLSEYRGEECTASDVKALEKSETRGIYTNKYYYGPKFDKIAEPLSEFMFDMGVMSGPDTSVKIVQRTVNMFSPAYKKAGFNSDGIKIRVDGVNGPKTRSAINTSMGFFGTYFYMAVIEERKNYLYAIVENNPSQEDFIDGWINRTEKFEVM